MENEDDLFRPAPLRGYQLPNAQLQIPARAIATTLAFLQRAGRCESGLFWYGPKDASGNGRVAYVAAPHQRMAPRNYHVPSDALSELVRGLADNWAPLAQVHSHPGVNVEHSNFDDRMVSTRKALSLVFPFYGRPRDSFPKGIGVHEFQIDYWHLLDADDAARRVIICDGDVKVDDFR